MKTRILYDNQVRVCILAFAWSILIPSGETALTVRQSNGTSGSIYSTTIGLGENSRSTTTVRDTSMDSLRGQTFIARIPDDEAGWTLTSVTLQFNTTDGLPTVGPDDIWTVTIIEWEPEWDAGDFSNWLSGDSNDPLSGFSSPTIIAQDSGAFETEMQLSGNNRPYFIFDFDESQEYFIEAGKAYAVLFSYDNPSGGGLLVETRIPVVNSQGTMIYQNAGSGPEVLSGEKLTVWVHGNAITPGDGRDLAPRFSLSGDIELPLNFGPYTEVHASEFISFNEGQSLVGYTIESDNNGLFSIQPSIDNQGILTFTPIPDTPGVANVTVYASDDGLTNNRSYQQTFTLTITDREVTTIHVNASTAASPSEQTGESWESAFASLQDALASAVDLDEIWVAKGIYYPDEAAAGVADVTENDVESVFQLRDNVPLYGGFSGIEQSREERDPIGNLTILSGDIDHETQPDIQSNRIVLESPETNIKGENANLVAEGTNSGKAILDGFVITAGYQSTFYPGGAIENGASLSNCRIQGNYGKDYGPITVFESNLTLINCDVFSNTGGGSGAIYTYGTSVQLISCRVQGNHANSESRYNSTGGILVGTGNHLIENSLITGNRGASVGGVNLTFGNDNGEAGQSITIRNTTLSGNEAYGDIHESTVEVGDIKTAFGDSTFILNSILWGNAPILDENSTGLDFTHLEYSIVEGLNPGGSNFDGTNPANNPLFQSPILATDAPTLSGNVRLLSDSPLINVGEVSLLSEDVADLDSDSDTTELLPLDVMGNARVIATLDLGAIEHVAASSPLNSLSEFRAYHGLSNDGADDATESKGNGLPILLSYAFGIEDPSVPFVAAADPETGTPGIPRLERSSDGATLEFTHVRRINDGSNLIFTIQKSTDLTHWVSISDSDGTIGDTTIVPYNSRYEFVVVEFLPSEGSRFYYRLNVES